MQRNGILLGLDAVLNGSDSFRRVFLRLREEPYLNKRIASTPTAVSLPDVITFGAAVMSGSTERFRSTRELRFRDIIVGVLWDVIEAVVEPFQGYLSDIYGAQYDMSVPPPVLRYTRAVAGQAPRSRAATLDAASAWGVIERARHLHGLNIRNVLECKSDEAPYLGLAAANAGLWEKM